MPLDHYLLEIDLENFDNEGAEAAAVDVFVNDDLKFLLILKKNEQGDVELQVVTKVQSITAISR